MLWTIAWKYATILKMVLRLWKTMILKNVIATRRLDCQSFTSCFKLLTENSEIALISRLKCESWRCMIKFVLCLRTSFTAKLKQGVPCDLISAPLVNGPRIYMKKNYCSKYWQWASFQNVDTVLKPTKQDLQYLLQSIYSYFIEHNKKLTSGRICVRIWKIQIFKIFL